MLSCHTLDTLLVGLHPHSCRRKPAQNPRAAKHKINTARSVVLKRGSERAREAAREREDSSQRPGAVFLLYDVVRVGDGKAEPYIDHAS